MQGKARPLFLLFFLIGFFGCNEDEQIDKSKRIAHVDGYVQKGPFINGTSIFINELTSDLNQTGQTFSTQIKDNSGSFELEISGLESDYLELSANGFYFDEVKGAVSVAPLNLYGLAEINDNVSVNVNILTHLQRFRVKYLVEQGETFSAAKTRSEVDILKIFGVEDDAIRDFETLDISHHADGNAFLLAISVILQGDRSVGDLSELLAAIADDIEEDSVLNKQEIYRDLRASTLTLDIENIKSNLEARYEELEIESTIPDFEKYITTFLALTGEKPDVSIGQPLDITTTTATFSGEVNANSLETTVIFEYGTTPDYGSTLTATQSPLMESSSATVSAHVVDLLPGTNYHLRIRAENELGVVYSGDLTFNTLGATPSVNIHQPTDITTASATLNGQVNANFLSTTVVFEYGTTAEYGSVATATQSPLTGGSIADVSVGITGLSPGTTYHYRIKAENQLGVVYSSESTFQAAGAIPLASIQPATDITTASATLNGKVNANYLSTAVTFEYGTSLAYGNSVTALQSPLTGSAFVNVGAPLTGLSPGTSYYYRIKAENELGDVYSNELTFKTAGAAPSVSIDGPLNITNTTATIKGQVSANSLSTAVVFEYGTSTSYGNSVVAVESPVTGTLQSNVSAELTGLTPGTTYHVRLAATNVLGDAYSQDVALATTITGLIGTVTDVDGNVYPTIGIGYDEWMAANLKVTKWNDGTSIPLVTDNNAWKNLTTPAFSWYNHDEAIYKDVYGALYNWFAANNTSTLCPTGWHVPTDDEWRTMELILDPNVTSGTGPISYIAGGKLKEVGTLHWLAPNTGATDEYGLSALPGGSRDEVGVFNWIGSSGYYWTSSPEPQYGQLAIYRQLARDSQWLYRSNYYKTRGYSVRCVKDLP